MKTPVKCLTLKVTHTQTCQAVGHVLELRQGHEFICAIDQKQRRHGRIHEKNRRRLEELPEVEGPDIVRNAVPDLTGHVAGEISKIIITGRQTAASKRVSPGIPV